MMSYVNFGGSCTHFVGIDVAKKSFVLATSSLPKTKSYDNTVQGIDEAICFINEQQMHCANGKTLVVLESTGGLEVPLAKALCLAGIDVIVANPRQTHQFAKSQSLTKTDNKDAKLLCQNDGAKRRFDNIALSSTQPKPSTFDGIGQ